MFSLAAGTFGQRVPFKSAHDAAVHLAQEERPTSDVHELAETLVSEIEASAREMTLSSDEHLDVPAITIVRSFTSPNLGAYSWFRMVSVKMSAS